LHINVYQTYARLVYFISFILLGAVLIFGSTIRGTTGWFRIAGFSFQPAEAAKVGLVMVLAWLVVRYGRRFHRPQFMIASGFLAGVPIILILLQPDLGSALVLFTIWFGTMILAGIKKRYVILLLVFLIAGFFIGWFFLFQTYQKERLFTFVDSERDPLGAGYNVTQSVIAIGSGGFFGRGLGFGSQSQLHFLPEAQTDFIFAVIAEELGFVGAVIVLVLFFLMLWRLIRIARLAGSEFGAYLVSGIVLLFLIQLVLNIGGAAGLLPITGVTLPFVSYGGSSLLAFFAALGILMSLKIKS